MTRKVMIISYGLSMGGLQRASSVLANQLSEDVEVVFYAITKADHFFSLNSNIALVEPATSFNIFSLSFFPALKALRKAIRTINPEAVLVFGKFLGAFSMLATLFLNTKVILTERMSPVWKEKISVRIFNRLAYLLKKPTAIIAQTNIAREYQQKYFGSRIPISVIPNALRRVQLYPEIQRKNQILAVGRMGDTLKGFDRLLDAFALISNKDWILVFAGGDEDGFDLKKQAEKLGILNRVSFLGRVKNIDSIYAESGIFVIPSRNEGFPNALCEAMAAGLPCISFDFIAGPRDIIQSGVNGIIVPDGDIRAMAKSIDFLIDNPHERERLGKNAMEISNRLDSGKITKEILNFILPQL